MWPWPSTTSSFPAAGVEAAPTPALAGGEQPPLPAGHDQHPSVAEPVDAARERGCAQDDLAPPADVDRDHLPPAPVGEPEPPVVPARLLSEQDAGHQNLRLAGIRHF